MKNNNPIKQKNQIFYTRGEELFNIISHLLGALLAVAGGILCIIFCCIHAYRGKYVYPAVAIVSVCLFTAMISILYIMSTLYHSRKFGTKSRLVFRKFDHCSIALLIQEHMHPTR